MNPPALRQILWINTIFLAFAHLMALGAIGWMVFVHFSWWTLALGLVWLNLCTLAISAGYHRLFSHRALRRASGPACVPAGLRRRLRPELGPRLVLRSP